MGEIKIKMKADEYLGRIYKISGQYGLPTHLIYSLVDALEGRRADRKRKDNMEKSFNTLERWLRIKNANRHPLNLEPI
jgi:hypothetical protein